MNSLKLGTLAAIVCLVGCSSTESERASDNRTNDNRTYDNRMDSSSQRDRSTAASTTDQPTDTRAATEDSRILGYLHAKNQEEIAIGQLAQNVGNSDQARQFGSELERDHKANDAKVQALATKMAIDLDSWKPWPGYDGTARTAGERPPNPSMQPTDPVMELRAVSNQDFDREFAQKMKAGHAEVIKTVENALESVRNSRVQQLLKDTLPTLKEHEGMATELAGK